MKVSYWHRSKTPVPELSSLIPIVIEKQYERYYIFVAFLTKSLLKKRYNKGMGVRKIVRKKKERRKECKKKRKKERKKRKKRKKKRKKRKKKEKKSLIYVLHSIPPRNPRGFPN